MLESGKERTRSLCAYFHKARLHHLQQTATPGSGYTVIQDPAQIPSANHRLFKPRPSGSFIFLKGCVIIPNQFKAAVSVHGRSLQSHSLSYPTSYFRHSIFLPVTEQQQINLQFTSSQNDSPGVLCSKMA